MKLTKKYAGHYEARINDSTKVVIRKNDMSSGWTGIVEVFSHVHEDLFLNQTYAMYNEVFTWGDYNKKAVVSAIKNYLNETI